MNTIMPNSLLLWRHNIFWNHCPAFVPEYYYLHRWFWCHAQNPAWADFVLYGGSGRFADQWITNMPCIFSSYETIRCSMPI